MSAATLPHWLAAALLSLLLGSAYRLDAPTDHNTEMAQAQALEDAIKSEAADARFERAVAELCGENAGHKPLEDGAIQCYTHSGHKTVRVAL